MKTWIFGILVVLVAGLTFLDQWHTEKSEEEKDKASQLFEMKPAQVTEMEIQNTLPSDGKTQVPPIKMSKAGGIWKITEPIQDEADQSQVDSFLTALLGEKSVAVPVEGDNIRWEQFGLDKPKTIFRLKAEGGTTASVQVSATKNFQGDSYIRVGDQKRVIVGSREWLTRSEKSVIDFRDKRVRRGPMGEVESITVEAKGQPRFELKNSNGQWAIVGKSFPLVQHKVRDLLTTFTSTNVTDFVLEANPNNLQKKQFGFEPALLNLSYSLKDGKSWAVHFGEGKSKDALVWTSEPAKVGKLTGGDLNRIKAYSIDYFRDKNLPLKFSAADARKIIYKGAKATQEFVYTGGFWTTQGLGPNQEVDTEKIKSALESLARHEVDGFEGKPGKYDRRLTVKNEKDETLVDLEWSSAIPQKASPDNKLLTSLKSDRTTEVVVIDKVYLDNQGFEAFVRQKPAPEALPVPPPPPPPPGLGN